MDGANRNASGVPPPVTRLTVLVQTPTGGPVNDVEVTALTHKQKTGPNSNRAVFTIPDAEYDQQIGPMGLVNLVATRNHFGPPAQGSSVVQPGDALATISILKGTSAAKIMQLQDVALNRYTDLNDSILVRDLTQRQARDTLLCLHRQGLIQLIPEPVFKHTSDATCSTSCKLQHPLAGERVGMKALVNAGVQYLSITNGIMPGDRANVTTRADDLTLLDARNAVGLFRLARGLSNTFGAMGITHIGVSGADPATRNDCHGQGRAVDFGGVTGADPTSGDYNLFIYYDWGLMQVFDEKDPETDLSKKRRLPKGQNWPPGDRPLMYRLDPLPPGGSDLAKRMFQEVYDFCVDQYSDKQSAPNQSAGASHIGEGGLVMNADHKASDPGGPHGREAHLGHIHMQVGGTGTDPVPPIEAE